MHYSISHSETPLPPYCFSCNNFCMFYIRVFKVFNFFITPLSQLYECLLDNNNLSKNRSVIKVIIDPNGFCSNIQITTICLLKLTIYYNKLT